MVNPKHPAVVIGTGIFVVLSIAGFCWMNKLIAVNSFEFLTALDYSDYTQVAIAGGCAALFAGFIYMINFPEGELARDAAASFKEKESKKQ